MLKLVLSILASDLKLFALLYVSNSTVNDDFRFHCYLSVNFSKFGLKSLLTLLNHHFLSTVVKF